MNAEKAMNEIPEMVKCLLKKAVYSKDYSISNACKEIASEASGFFVPVKIQESANEMLLYAQRADALQEACFNLGDKGQVYKDVKALLFANIWWMMGSYEDLVEECWLNTKEDCRCKITQCLGDIDVDEYLWKYEIGVGTHEEDENE